MTRRSGLAVAFVALLTVGWTVVSIHPGDHARAADPQSELADTKARLADAKSAQSALSDTLDRQRAELAQLKQRSADLDDALDRARSELASVNAQLDHVTGLLAAAEQQVDDIEKRLDDLHRQIDELDDQLTQLAGQIRQRNGELADRESLLQEHLRGAYERSQTSLLEVLLTADSLDQVTSEVGYLMTMTEQDAMLADEIRSMREELDTRRASLQDGRAALRDARRAATREQATLEARRDELADLRTEWLALQDQAEAKQAAQEDALNDALAAQDDVEAKIAQNERAARELEELSRKLAQRAKDLQAQIDEAKRREEEEGRQGGPPSAYGFRWPERATTVTQEWGPTGFVLEPPYSYRGTWYPHFHTGIDFAAGCWTKIYATGPGVVVASGQPLLPWDTGYGVVIDHGGGIMTWYWHMQPKVVVAPGTIVTSNTLIGYEGTTGLSTGCHVHFAINDHGVWENPRRYLP